MKDRVLLIIHDVYQDDNAFPLGPGYLAAVLSENNIDVDVYCMDVYHYSNKDLAQYLQKNEYNIIGLGFLAARYKETIEPLCEIINKYKKNAWLVLGGHGPSAIPEYMLEKTKADAIVIGEAEKTIFEVLRCKQENNNPRIFHGELVKKLDTIPFPKWDLFPMDIYSTCMVSPEMGKDDRSLNLISSRGCTNACSFCYRMEQGFRVRSIDNLVEEMKFLNKNYGVTYFEFADELFILNKKRLERFTQTLDENKLDIKYWCVSRVDGVDEELLNMLKKSGCTFINYGFESMSEEVLTMMKKNTTPEENEHAAKLTKESGIPFGINIIWGNPGDTPETLKKDVEFIKKYNCYSQIRTIRPITPYPGCSLFNYAVNKGLLKGPEDFFNRFKNSDLIAVNFTEMDLDEMYKLLFEANKDLLYDHFKHTTGNLADAEPMIQDFKKLYFQGFTKFRGARHYKRDEEENISTTNL